MATQNYSSISIIYNPIATGPAPESAKELRAALQKALPKTAVKLVETKYKYHAIELGQTLAIDPNALIIYTGGDGGYHELMNGVMKLPPKQRPIVAVNPAGNANDHHRAIVGSDNDLTELILQYKIKFIDLLGVNIKHPKHGRQVYAHSYVGMGATGRVARSLDEDRQQGKRFVRIRQMGAIILELLADRSFPVQTDDGTLVHLKNIIATNAPEMAMILKVSKDSKITDGKFELVVTPAGSRRLFLRQVAKAVTAGLEPRGSHTEYTFKLLGDVDGQIDGEVYHFAKDSVITLKSEPKAIRTLLA